MFIEYLKNDPRFYVAVVLVVVISISFHELAHGLIAVWRGDRTPIDDGRITLNPLVHMGPISLLVLLIAGIAWGAMPIDRTRLRGRYAEALVALAGPATNVLISALALSVLGLWQRLDPWATTDQLSNFADNGRLLLKLFGIMNLALAMFNLLPVPPLDGYHVLGNLSPAFARAGDSLRMSGASIIAFLVVFSFAGRIIFPAAIRGAEWYLLKVRGY
jgi:Zn-dependent protease